MGVGFPFRWIQTLEELEEVCAQLPDLIALDLEADFLYRYRERICLIQISTGQENLLIDPLSLPHLEPLRLPLEDPSVEKVLHGGDYDVRLLKGLARIYPKGLFDTMVAAQLLGADRLGLSDLLMDRLGVRLDKRYQKADWGRRPLPPGMLRYAVLDTCYLIPLRHSLRQELIRKGRLPWAEEEFHRLSRVTPTLREGPDALRMRGASRLDPKRLAVLQTLLDWREEEARRRDVPPHRILPSRLLISLAQVCPTNMKELRDMGKVGKRTLSSLGESLLRVVRRGLEAPPLTPERSSPRRGTPRPGARKRLQRLKAIRDSIARELGLDPGVLCPNAVLKSLAEAWPHKLEDTMEEVLKRWQRDLLWRNFQRVLYGRG